MVYALTSLQLIYIIIASSIGAAVLFFLLFIPITRLYHRRHYKEYYYKLIYKIALYNDYYLINNFVFRIDQNHITSIDHILFGRKFIYIIMDKTYDGDLMGSNSDPSLVLLFRKGGKTYVDNPYYAFNRLLSRLSTATGIDTDYMIGITIVNNECRMKINSQSKQFFMVQRKRLKKLIKLIESRNIGAINEKELQEAVLTVNRLNRKQ